MNIPSFDIDFYSDEVIKDPYPVYARMRELGPVVYLPQHELYALPRYREVSEVLRKPLRFTSSRGVSPIERVNNILRGSTLNSDPPEHDLTRAVTSEPLLPGALQAIEPRIQQAAEGLVDTLCQRQQFDAVADFAQFLPVTIVAELVGLPDHGKHNMLKWASATFNLFGDDNARSKAAFDDLQELRDFLVDYGRPEQLKTGSWAKRIFEEGPKRGISLETCAQLMRDYINPSLDTTISVTGQIIKLFADNPEQWARVRANPELISNAVEEAVRLSSPIRAFTRYVTKDSKVAGASIPASSRVLVMFASANRDAAKYENADQFDVTRDVHDHLGFGQGIHMCMGMHLARLEMMSLLDALQTRVKSFTLTGDAEVAMNNTIRAYSKLPVRVDVDDTIRPLSRNAKQVTHRRAESIEAEIDPELESFEVVAQQSGVSVVIEPGDSIAEKLMEQGVDVDMSCQAGVCGTCLTPVVSGRPDHCDMVQTEDEKASNEQMTICCSRSKSKRLVLDV